MLWVRLRRTPRFWACRRLDLDVLLGGATLAPGVEGLQGGPELIGFGGETVLDRAVLRRPFDQSGLFEVPQSLGQHLLTDVRHQPAQFPVSEDAFLEVRENHDSPLAADDVDGQLDRAVVPRASYAHALQSTYFRRADQDGQLSR